MALISSSEASDLSISKNKSTFYQALIKGIVTNNNRTSNNCSKNNLLNRAILSTLNNRNVNDFSLKLIDSLIEGGADPFNDGDSSNGNTLLFTLNHGNKYIDSFLQLSSRSKFYDCDYDCDYYGYGCDCNNDYYYDYCIKIQNSNLAEDNVVKLMDLLIIKYGGEIPAQVKLSILISALKTGRSKIIKRIFRLYMQSQEPGPAQTDLINIKKDNGYAIEGNILNFALLTENDELLANCLKYYTETDQHTLSYAVKTNNPKIILKIIMIGARPNNDAHYWDFSSTTFYKLYKIYKNTRSKDIDFRIFNQIVELLMCSGAKISDAMYRDLRINQDRKINKKILDCYYLLNGDCPFTRLEYVRNLKDKLKTRMQQMVDVSYCRERNCEIENTIICMPICCTNLIYEYQINEPKFNIIDWSQ